MTVRKRPKLTKTIKDEGAHNDDENTVKPVGSQ